MSHEEFVELVAKMREHQKAFFRGRSPNDLSESKRYEKAVDRAIEKFNSQDSLIEWPTQ